MSHALHSSAAVMNAMVSSVHPFDRNPSRLCMLTSKSALAVCVSSLGPIRPQCRRRAIHSRKFESSRSHSQCRSDMPFVEGECILPYRGADRCCQLHEGGTRPDATRNTPRSARSTSGTQARKAGARSGNLGSKNFLLSDAHIASHCIFFFPTRA